MSETTDLYEKDFTAWGEAQTEALRQLARDRPELAFEYALDFANLIEEMEALGRSEPRAVRSRLQDLLMHLAKWRYQPERRSKSWTFSILHHRKGIADLLEDSPSLVPRLPAWLPKAWQRARRDAADETGLPLDTFPVDCPFTLEETMDLGWLP
jgi:hypothetical protein